MKKLGVALCAFLLALGISGCKGSKVEEKAVDTYAKAIEKFSDMKSGNFNIKLLVDTDDLNTHAKVAMDGSFNGEGKLQMTANMNAAVNGIGLDDVASMYMKDDKLYINVMQTEKEYIEMPKDATDKLRFDEETAKLKKDVKDTFSEFTMEEKDGKRIITGVLNEKSQNSFKKGFDKKAKTDKTAKELGMRFDKINEATVTFTINEDGFMEKMDMKVDLNLHMKDPDNKDKEKSVNMAVEAVISFSDFNTVKSIDFPSFKDYKKTDGTTSSQDILKEIEDGNAI